MKVFVSGSSGFIGSAVVSELSRRGHEVIGMVRDDAEAKLVKSLGGKPVIGDLLKGGEWCDAVKDVDKVISLTKPYRDDENIPIDKMEEYGARHAEEVTNLIKAAAEGRAKGIIITYDTLCFGDRNGKWVEADAGAVDPAGCCRPLTGSFDVIQNVLDESGLAAVTVFPSMVYGNGSWFKWLVENIQSGTAKISGSGDNYLNLIHVDDVAALYSMILEKIDTSDVFIMSDSRPVSQRTFMDLLSAMLDKPMPESVDVKSYEKLFGLIAAESMSCNTRTSAEKLINTLGYNFKYKSCESGIAATLKSMGIEPMEMEYRRVA